MNSNFNEWEKFSNDYFDIISKELSGLNLTSLSSSSEIYQKQVLDSILPIDQIEILKETLNSADYIVDLGTGGGFPLLPIAKLFKNKRCIGIDARNKKLQAVLLIAKKLNLNNVQIIHSRFDSIIFNKPKIVFLVKAVGKTSFIIDQLKLEYPADIFFYKGLNFHELEIEEIEKLKNNKQLHAIYNVQIEGLENRYIVQCKLSSNVPHGTILKKQDILFTK